MKHHKQLTAAKWGQLSLAEQMANIGSEVFRSISWMEKENPDYAQKAFERSLELLHLTQEVTQQHSRLKEISRVKECWSDYFSGGNTYNTTKEGWQNYFMQFTYLARNRG